MTVRKVNIADSGPPTKPPLANFRPGVQAQRIHVHQAFAAQDRPVGAGRRVVMPFGLGGASNNLVPETDPASGASSTHADSSTPYVYRRGLFHVTQGHRLYFTAWVIPSGATQKLNGSNYVEDNRSGQIKIESTWTPTGLVASAETTSQTYDLPRSQLQYGATPSGNGTVFPVIQRITGIIYPPSGFFNMDTARKLGTQTEVELTVSLVGGARVVDGCVWEFPGILAIDDDDDNWAGHVYALGLGPAQAYPFAFPIEGSPSGDDRLGIKHALDTAASMPKQLGPMIGHFCAGSDDDDITDVVSFGIGTGNDEMTYRAVTSTSFELLTRPGKTYAAGVPGWSMRCGTYGRDFAQSDPDYILPTDGVVRVQCSVYAKGTVAGDTLTVRFQTKEWSYIDVVCTATSAEITNGDGKWYKAVGWVSTGRNPNDDVVMVPSVKVSSTQWDVGYAHASFYPDNEAIGQFTVGTLTSTFTAAEWSIPGYDTIGTLPADAIITRWEVDVTIAFGGTAMSSWINTDGTNTVVADYGLTDNDYDMSTIGVYSGDVYIDGVDGEDVQISGDADVSPSVGSADVTIWYVIP